jgi:hypothetical protein
VERQQQLITERQRKVTKMAVVEMKGECGKSKSMHTNMRKAGRNREKEKRKSEAESRWA